MNRRTFLNLALLAGISGASAIANAKNKTPTVNVLGDRTAKIVASQLRKRGVPIVEGGLLKANTKIAIIAQDAASGMLPLHRKLVRRIGAISKVHVVWMITSTETVEDVEMLQLEAYEANELMAAKGVVNARQRIAFDAILPEAAQKSITAWTGSPPLLGWDSCAKYLTLLTLQLG